ncbi:MAG: outer membrane protein and related peptidoglycan-associated protein [Bacteroidetes bacterium]|nr:outer membrane protein and related peptidoglycan-associated protein [Bacteroidota bacterium]
MKEMKKIIITSLFILVSAFSFAQEAEKQELKPNESYLVGSLKDNWFFSLGVGAQTYLGENYSTGSFFGHISPAFDIAAGKWFTPVMGTRLQLSGFNARGYNSLQSPYVSGNPNDDGTYEMNFNYLNVHADFLFNLTAQLFRYNENRCYELIPFAGFGWAGILKDGISENELAFSAGLINQFRVNDKLDINLELKGMLVNQRFDGTVGGRVLEGTIGLTAGITYKFGKETEFKAGITPDVIAEVEKKSAQKESELQNQNDALKNSATDLQRKSNDLSKALEQEKQKNAKLQKEIEELKNRPQTTSTPTQTPASTPKEVKADFTGIKVFFEIGKTTLDDKNFANLENVAKCIKDSKRKVTITGYADSSTGKMSVNKKLALKRAQNIYNILVEKYGVNKDLLSVESSVVDPKGLAPEMMRMVEIK